MSDFVAGFSARQNAAAAALQQAFTPPGDFARTDLPGLAGLGIDLGSEAMPFRARSPMPGGQPEAEEVKPRHFHPVDPERDPTEGWDPLAACEDIPEATVADPIAMARAAGYAEGVEAATHEYQALLESQARDGQLLEGIAQAFTSRVDREMMAGQLRQTVMALVTRLVGEVGIDADRLTARVEGAIELLTDAQESAMLRVHPDDVALLDGRLPQTIFPVGDATIERGSFVLESASTIVEDGPRLWLDQLAAIIDKVPVPQC
ncbi:FliH/SctL family protein [uncultured Sphingomonas sp.]|uniref:FliH/SctL family protein n=1 Tax=uncultured Sphingomonas sp. TaxID=158754 RepID=UPI0025E35218|nr:FliH/SctL family protein [uncultured Sphingomonas sp.]